MHSLTVDCDTFSNEGKVAVVAPVRSVEFEVTGSEAILAPVVVSLVVYLLSC